MYIHIHMYIHTNMCVYIYRYQCLIKYLSLQCVSVHAVMHVAVY